MSDKTIMLLACAAALGGLIGIVSAALAGQPESRQWQYVALVGGIVVMLALIRIINRGDESDT